MVETYWLDAEVLLLGLYVKISSLSNWPTEQQCICIFN